MRPNLFLFATLSFLLGFSFMSHGAFAETVSATTAKKMAAGVAAADAGNPATRQIERTVHEYLMKKPEVIVQALQIYQQKQMESMQQVFKDTQKMAPQYADALFHQNADPVGGNAQGKITLVEFSDYQCAHCIEIASVIDAVMKANPNLRIVVKEFPIRGILSETAARAALAANKQGKYWEFRDSLFKNGSALTQDKILELAQPLGLNINQFKKDMDDSTIHQQVAANQKLAQTLKLIGTPAFFVAKSDVKPDAPFSSISYIPGIISQQQLQSIIDQLSH